MCLIVFRIDPETSDPLLLIGNRDEFHARPTQGLHRWDEPAGIAGGRDLAAGGTWLAAHANGRFATVTNSRDGAAANPKHRSRGWLITDFLESSESALDYLASIRGEHYAGFNLVLFDGESVAYGSNRDPRPPRILRPGVYSVSNAIIDTPWHKLERAKSRFLDLMATDSLDDESLFAILRDEQRADVTSVDDSVLPFETAHRVTAPFVADEQYGTRCSTIVRWRTDRGFILRERRFGPGGRPAGETQLALKRTVS